MSAPNVLERVLSRGRLEVFSNRCLRMRHRKSSCRLCLDNCPADAVRLEDSPSVDYSVCWSCGICANLCPTGVFQLKEPSYRALLAKARAGGTVEFSCGQLPAVEEGTVPVPCLGYLNESVLVGIAASGAEEVRLNVSPCEKCQMGPGLPVSMKTVARANRLLTLFGLPDRVSARTDGPGGAHSVGSDRRFSRRELFSYLGRGARDVVTRAGSVAADEIDRSGPGRAHLETRLPEKRVMLLQNLKQLGPPFAGRTGAGDLPFAQVAIDEKCDGCGMCITFCPTGALYWHDEDETKTIVFRPGHCLACGLCQEVCLRDSLQLVPEISPRNIIEDASSVLIEHRTAVCPVCGERYIVLDGSKRCPACTKRDGLRQWLTKN